MGRVWQFPFVACLATHDLEDCQGTIGSRSVEILVLIVDANASDVLGMRLDFELLVGGEGVHDHLDRARLVRVVNAGEEGPTVEEHLDLVEDDALEEGANDCALSDLTDGLVLAGREDRDLTLLAFGLVDAKAREVNVGLCEGPDWVRLAQSPHVNRRIERRRYKTRIVLQPRDRPNHSAVGLESVVDWILSCVEVVDVDEVDEHAGEKVSTVGEDDFTARLDWQILVLLDRVCEYIHHTNTVEEAYHNLETSWVEGYADGIILELLVDLQLETQRWAVAPNLDGSVRRASRDQVLLDAHIHARD